MLQCTIRNAVDCVRRRFYSYAIVAHPTNECVDEPTRSYVMTQYSIPLSQFLLLPMVSQSTRKKTVLPTGRSSHTFFYCTLTVIPDVVTVSFADFGFHCAGSSVVSLSYFRGAVESRFWLPERSTCLYFKMRSVCLVVTPGHS